MTAPISHAEFLARKVFERLSSPTPVMAGGEAEFVTYVHGQGRDLAEWYVASRLMHVLRRLDDPNRSAAARVDGPIAFGAYVALRGLNGEYPPDWLVTS